MPAKLKFSALHEKDIEELLYIERECHSHPWSQGIFHDCFKAGYQFLGCKESGYIVGYIVMMLAVDELHILNVCVTQSHQGQGVGKQLIEQSHAIAKKQQAVACFLEVRASNRVAQSLYQQLGYDIISTRKDYYPSTQGREDAIIMKKHLTTPSSIKP